jgi:hypothetical protein
MKPPLPLDLQNDIRSLGREIAERERAIQALRRAAGEHCGAWLAEVALQGQALIKAKFAVGHGNFGTWLKVNCPFSHDTANVYMRVAANYERARNLGEGASLRHAVALLTEGEGNAQDKPERALLPYLEALGRVSKFCGYLQSHKLENSDRLLDWWPDEGREKLRADLEPVARELWPERFGE